MRNVGARITSVLWLAGLLLFAMTAAAQSTKDSCGPNSVIPLPSPNQQTKAKITVNEPLPGPLASRGVAIIEYCAQNLHIVPVFGPDAVAASPRVGHLHVTVDDAAWHWADASGNPIILQNLAPGPHKVLIELADANHHILDKGTVTFTVPEKAAAEKH